MYTLYRVVPYLDPVKEDYKYLEDKTKVQESEDLSLLVDDAMRLSKEYTTQFEGNQFNECLYAVESERAPLLRGTVRLLDPMIEPAINLAVKYHGSQTRKGDGRPYLEHPLEVAYLLWEQALSPVVIAAGYCHDLLEDSTCEEIEIEQMVSKQVLDVVKAVSNDAALESNEDWEKKKLKYIETVKAGGPDAISVAVADKIANLRSFDAQYKKEGPALWSKFNRGKEQKLWFELEVLKMAKENLGSQLVADYERVLKEHVKLAE